MLHDLDPDVLGIAAARAPHCRDLDLGAAGRLRGHVAVHALDLDRTALEHGTAPLERRGVASPLEVPGGHRRVRCQGRCGRDCNQTDSPHRLLLV